MSAKLMKALAAGTCVVSNRRSGQVRVYWDDKGVSNYIDIDGHAKSIDLATHAPIASLRKSKSLKRLVHEDHLIVHAV